MNQQRLWVAGPIVKRRWSDSLGINLFDLVCRLAGKWILLLRDKQELLFLLHMLRMVIYLDDLTCGNKVEKGICGLFSWNSPRFTRYWSNVWFWTSFWPMTQTSMHLQESFENSYLWKYLDVNIYSTFIHNHQKLRQPWCTPIGESINCRSSIQWNISLTKSNELIKSCKGMDVSESILLSERKSEKLYATCFHLYDILEKTQLINRLVTASSWRQWELNRWSMWDILRW